MFRWMTVEFTGCASEEAEGKMCVPGIPLSVELPLWVGADWSSPSSTLSACGSFGLRERVALAPLWERGRRGPLAKVPPRAW